MQFLVREFELAYLGTRCYFNLGLITFLGSFICYAWLTYSAPVARACSLMWVNTALLLLMNYPLFTEPYGSIPAMVLRFVSLTFFCGIQALPLLVWTVCTGVAVVRAFAATGKESADPPEPDPLCDAEDARLSQ